MANDNHTHIIFIMDCSGSMGGIFQPLQDAMHLMLEQQARKLAGYITVDVNYFEGFLTRGPRDADPMTVHLNLFASGGTDIYKPTRTVLDEARSAINAKPEHERPGHVIVVIMTDGQSSGHSEPARQAVKERMKAGWDFAFLAADKQAMQHADLGLPQSSMIYEPPTKEGVEAMAQRLGGFVSMARSGADAHF